VQAPAAVAQAVPSTLEAPGVGRVHVARTGDRSVVTRAFATSPLRLLTPANHGRAAWIYTSSYGGGLVDGDCLTLDMDVGCGAAAFLSTQASTKVYRSPNGTSHELRGRVHPGGMLVVAPDPVVCFRGARYRQTQRFDVAVDAGLVVVDCLLAGRCASGERWAFDEYRGRLEVAVGGSLALCDSTRLRASDGDLARQLGRFRALGLAVVAGGLFRDEIRRLILSVPSGPPAPQAAQLTTVAPLAGEGCLIRIAGVSGEAVGRALRGALSFVPARLGDDPWHTPCI
jgi:urease accessory protein